MPLRAEAFTALPEAFAEGAAGRGEFAGQPPNGRTFRIQGCGFFHVVDGLIKFQRGYWDNASWLHQLGIAVT